MAKSIALMSMTDKGDEVREYFINLEKRYQRGDPALAADIIDRQTDPAKAKWLSKRAEGKAVRLKFTDTLKYLGVKDSDYGVCTNAIYSPLVGGTARQVKVERGFPQKASLRDAMTSVELAAVSFAEELAIEEMQSRGAYGGKECAKVCAETGERVATVLNK